MRVYGRAEMVEREGRFGPGPYMRIVPDVSWSWNVEPATGQGFEVHKTVH